MSRNTSADSNDGRPELTETQREWADWSAHGYRKLYQPRSIRRFGLRFTIVLAVLLLTVFWLAAHGMLR
jgi:hypothetical protein